MPLDLISIIKDYFYLNTMCIESDQRFPIRGIVPNIDRIMNGRTCTVLSFATRRKAVEMVELLIDLGANLLSKMNVVGFEEYSILGYAREKASDLVSILEAGVEKA